MWVKPTKKDFFDRLSLLFVNGGRREMDDNYEKILWEGYGLHFLGGNRVRTGYLCKTEKGILEVRKSITPPKQILFEHDIKEHLLKQGFCVSKFLCSQQGLPYYTWEGNHYTVENAVESEAFNEEETQTFIIGAKLLAKLHKALNGLYSPSGYFSGKNRLEIYEKRRIELLKIKKRIEKQSSYTPLDLLVKQQFPYYMEKIEEAKQLFLEINYSEAIHTAEKQKTICHNIFKGENIRQNKNGIWITGLSKCTYDHNMVDLVMYFRRFLKKQDCDIATAEKMLSAYESENTLSVSYQKMLLALFIYPEKFLSLCNEYYNKRRVCVSPAMLERMERCIASIEKNEKMEQWLKTL